MLELIKMYKNIEWLFFDIGSTLVNEEKVYEERFKTIAKYLGYKYKYIHDKAINYYHNNMKGDLEVAKEFCIKLPEWNFKLEELYPETKKVLEELSKKYNIGIIANQKFGSSERLEEFGILKYIKLVIASAEEGIAKPDKRIFNIALERSKCKAEKSFMIGDRIDNDIVSAKEIGMKTIWIKQGYWQYWKMSVEERPNEIIYNLAELLKVLK